MLIVNDPHRGNSHLNDVAIIASVHVGAEPFGYVANIAHHVDVGGSAPASLGLNRELFQEGIILPGTLLVEGGKLDEGVMKLILSNVRAPRETGGDFRAQIAANMLGARRLAEVSERYGVGQLENWFDELLDYTERWTRAEIATLPRGEFSADGFRDNDGFSSRPRQDSRDSGNLRGFHYARRHRVGPADPFCSQRYAGSLLRSTAYVTKCLLDENILINDGYYRALSVAGPAGLVVTATRPAAVVGAWKLVSNSWRRCGRR